MDLANRIGILDFAGGTPVHISPRSAALAISICPGKRSRGDSIDQMDKPRNPTNVILGTVLLIFGECLLVYFGRLSLNIYIQDGLV